jgi:phospholipid-transporting ATPase
VSYCLSDKTGTLTRNEMVLRAVAVARSGEPGYDVLGEPTGEGLESAFVEPTGALVSGEVATLNWKRGILAKRDAEELPMLLFWLGIAVCHTSLVHFAWRGGQIEDDSSSSLDSEAADPSVPVFTGPSPDEDALLDAAHLVGITCAERTDTGYGVKIASGEERTKLEVEVLALLPFTSERKRMSVLVRIPGRRRSQDRHFLFCKGADSAVVPCVDAGTGLRGLDGAANDFAKEGLRTLMVAFREYIPDDPMLEEILTAYSEARSDTALSAAERTKALGDVAVLAERELQLLGVTAIEDKLQEGVPECLQSLIKANIRVWVLTGDKAQTAESIGKSSGLILPASKVLRLRKERPEAAARELQNLLRWRSRHERKFALVITDGQILDTHITMMSEQDSDDFFMLAQAADAVIVARATPAQKASVVDMLRHRTNGVLLSVGDGANDVYMIQRAHVGVAIRGREGNQAAGASDFAIGQFRFLERLILVHGHYNYWRISLLVRWRLFLCWRHADPATRS